MRTEASRSLSVAPCSAVGPSSQQFQPDEPAGRLACSLRPEPDLARTPLALLQLRDGHAAAALSLVWLQAGARVVRWHTRFCPTPRRPVLVDQHDVAAAGDGEAEPRIVVRAVHATLDETARPKTRPALVCADLVRQHRLFEAERAAQRVARRQLLPTLCKTAGLELEPALPPEFLAPDARDSPLVEVVIPDPRRLLVPLAMQLRGPVGHPPADPDRHVAHQHLMLPRRKTPRRLAARAHRPDKVEPFPELPRFVRQLQPVRAGVGDRLRPGARVDEAKDGREGVAKGRLASLEALQQPRRQHHSVHRLRKPPWFVTRDASAS
eukprot:3425902-Rhodomonas_salina.1